LTPTRSATPVRTDGQEKTRRRERRLQREAHRRLEPRDRLHILTDLVDAQRKMIEVADHKARFALVIMGAVNAALLLFATRGRVMESIPDGVKPWLLAVLVPYGILTFAFLLHAVEVLRPHTHEWAQDRAEARQVSAQGAPPGDEQPLGLFYWGDILRKDGQEYRALWRGARVGQVGAEMALLAHGLAHVNRIQFRALRGLFRGLQLMLALAAMVLALLTVFSLR
jgi:hypothetical protein